MRHKRDNELRIAEALAEETSKVEQRKSYLINKLNELQDKKKQLSYEEDKLATDNDYHLGVKRDLDNEEEQLIREIDALNKHCELLREQNRGISIELEDLVACDEIIRQRLDRKNRVNELRERNQDEMRRSAMNLERSKSPLRFSK